MWKSQNLLKILARDAGDYARQLLRLLFTEDELTTSILPSQAAHLYQKNVLDNERFVLLNGNEWWMDFRKKFQLYLFIFSIFQKQYEWSTVWVKMDIVGITQMYFALNWVDAYTTKDEEKRREILKRKNNNYCGLTIMNFKHCFSCSKTHLKNDS